MSGNYLVRFKIFKSREFYWKVRTKKVGIVGLLGRLTTD